MREKIEITAHLIFVWLFTIPVVEILKYYIADINALPELGIPDELRFVFGCGLITLNTIIITIYHLLTQNKSKTENIMIINIFATFLFTYMSRMNTQLLFLSIWQLYLFVYLKCLKKIRKAYSKTK